jgi:hypothetical protein
MELTIFTSSGAKMGRHLLISARCTDLFLTIGSVAWEQFGLTDPTAYVFPLFYLKTETDPVFQNRFTFYISRISDDGANKKRK